MEIKIAKRKGEIMENITSILIWLKVNNIAQIQYQGNQNDDFKYYDFITDKHYSRNQIIKLAKKSGYKDERF